MVNVDLVRGIVTEGYRKILMREPDSNGLNHYVEEICAGRMNAQHFLSCLSNSDEFRNKFGIASPQTILQTLSQRRIEGSPQIAIASIIRNEQENGYLNRFLHCCRELERYHNNMAYIFIEGDSSDRTFDTLKAWMEKKNGILEKIDKGNSPFEKDRSTKRTILFAELRNRLIDLVLSTSVSEVLFIDANYGWVGDLIQTLRETSADIAAPLVVYNKDGNGRYHFYDVWAFRKNGREFSSFYPYTDGLSDSPMEIDSVGGCYLVKRRVLESGVRYNGNNDSEHIDFCRKAKEKGFRIMITPKTYVRKGGFKI